MSEKSGFLYRDSFFPFFNPLIIASKEALNISYLYEVRETEDDNGNKQTYFRRRMTKDQRHILLLFIQKYIVRGLTLGSVKE